MGRRLVIVDDSRVFREAARRLLGADGYDVVGVAEDGGAALELVERLAPDVVVLDVALPDLDGFAVASRLALLDPRPTVVLVSSRDWADAEDRVRSCGAVGFVSKERLGHDTLDTLVRSV